ncbi:hypothetical protein AOLI_G00119560 [Acnodon oligacanthus]
MNSCPCKGEWDLGSFSQSIRTRGNTSHFKQRLSCVSRPHCSPTQEERVSGEADACDAAPASKKSCQYYELRREAMPRIMRAVMEISNERPGLCPVGTGPSLGVSVKASIRAELNYKAKGVEQSS